MELSKYINKDYISNTQFFRRKNTLIPVKVLVEGNDDIEFWKNVCSKYDKYNVSVATNKVANRNELIEHNGKDALMKWAPQLCDNFIICVDADYDLIIDNYHSYTMELRTNKYIINTVYYSIENILCNASNLTKIEKDVTMIESSFDYKDFLECFSVTISDLLLLLIASKTSSIENNASCDFLVKDFKKVVNGLKFHNSTYKQNFESFSHKYLNDNKLKVLFNKYEKEMNTTNELLRGYNYTDRDAYKLIQGHFLFDKIVEYTLYSICSPTIKESKSKIEKLLYNCKTVDEVMIPEQLRKQLNAIF